MSGGIRESGSRRALLQMLVAATVGLGARGVRSSNAQGYDLPGDPRPTSPAAAAPMAGREPDVLDPPELRAVWVDAFHDGFKTPGQVDALVAWARASNLNALFVQVRRRGDAYFNRATEPRTEDPDLASGFDALAYLIERAHGAREPGARRVQVHAWLATLAVWHKGDEAPAAATHIFNGHGLTPLAGETWLQLRDDGEAWAGAGQVGTYYLDPGHPDAARHTAEVYLHVMRNYDVDGIHLDHARYFEGTGRAGRWGYNPVSVARFNRAHGRDEESIPAPNEDAWDAWRRDQVTALVRRIYLEAKALKPSVAVSCAVVAWGDGPASAAEWNRTAPFARVYQDWRYWLAEGIVDYVLPMDYFRESGEQSGWFDRWLRFQQAERGRRGVVFGVGAYLNDLEATGAQIARARRHGALGTALYSYAVPSADAEAGPAAATRAQNEASGMLREIYPRPARVPDLPWITRAAGGNLLVDAARVEGAEVRLTGPTTRRWLTDGTGLAGGVDLPAGRYALGVTAPGIDGWPQDVSIEPGRTTVVRFGPGAGIS